MGCGRWFHFLFCSHAFCNITLYQYCCFQEIVKLEQVCTAMYKTDNANMREQAEKILIDLVNDVNVLQKCQLLFQRAAVS